MTKGIRGAITVDENTEDAIKNSTIELLSKMIEENSINISDISHVIFTLTNDLNAAFPAKFARLNLGFDKVAMMCYHELDVPNSLPKCLRILIVLNCSDDFEPKFVYLKGAENLRR
ncbi:MAG: chorismate mutase [bacterium]|nr:chorismate mutase [bacterium]